MEAPARSLQRDLWAFPVSLLPSQVREPRKLWLSIVVGWLTAFLPSLLIGALVTQLFPQSAQPQLPVSNWLGVFLMVVFAPVTETLIMAGVLAILLRLAPPTVAVVLSSIGWGIAHSMAAPAWGLVIWWPFFVFSTLFVAWRRRSLAAALLVPASAHALQNLLPALLLFYGAKI